MVEVEKLKQEAECLKSWFSGGLRTQEERHQSAKLLTQSSAGDIELIFCLFFFFFLFLAPLTVTYLIPASSAVALHSNAAL